MTYSEKEFSAQDGLPYLRYEFAQGSNVYRRTSEPNIVLDSDGSWMPSPIKPSEFSQTNEVAKDPLRIDLPRDDELAALFVGGVPEQITTLTVYRVHATDPDEGFQFYWKGRIVSSEIKGDAVQLACENIHSTMQRNGIRARYQKTCRHPLYGRGCGLNDYDFAVVGTATDVAGYVVTVGEALDSNTESGYYAGGMLETSDGFLRYIIKHEGDELTLLTPIPSLTAEIADSGSASVTIYPGCDHTRSTCNTKFNNLLNFGGFPWMTGGKNPFSNGVKGSIA